MRKKRHGPSSCGKKGDLDSISTPAQSVHQQVRIETFRPLDPDGRAAESRTRFGIGAPISNGLGISPHCRNSRDRLHVLK